MTTAIRNRNTIIRETVEWMKRMHLFHPGRFWSMVISGGILITSMVSLFIALPFIV